MTNDELLSKTIKYLRFPLIIGVVFIHNQMTTADIQGTRINYGDIWPWINYIIIFFSDILSRISVPLFFFISGFLFFYNTNFDKSVYLKKIKSRYHSLFIPYLIWNFVGFLVLLVQMHPRFTSLFPMLEGYRIDIKEFLSYFWMKKLPMDPPGESLYPINTPFWYIRDLMLLVLASPIIYWLIKKIKAPFIILLGAVWIFDLSKYIGIPSICNQSIFFFPLGAFFSINKINFVECFAKAKWTLFAYPFIAAGDLLTREGGAIYNWWLHCSGIMVGMIATVYLVSNLLKKEKVRINVFLSDASFFVFAVHGLFISKLMKVLVMTIHPQSPLMVLLIYFTVPIITILASLGMYKLFYMISPSTAKLVTGGR